MDLLNTLKSAGLVDFAALPSSKIPMLGDRRLPDGVKSAIVCLFPYYAGAFEGRNIALYAIGPDYHRVVMEMLEEAAAGLSEQFLQASFTALVDASPIDEKEAAQLSGLGEIGMNGLLISPRWGQFVFIGCLLTDIPYDALGATLREKPSLCEHCGRCVAACPTGALDAGTVERKLCLSSITQKKSGLSPWEEAQVALSGFAWGCDICQTACPRNSHAAKTPIAQFETCLSPTLTEESIDSLSDRAYLWRGREILRRNLRLITLKKGATDYI